MLMMSVGPLLIPSAKLRFRCPIGKGRLQIGSLREAATHFEVIVHDIWILRLECSNYHWPTPSEPPSTHARSDTHAFDEQTSFTLLRF